MKARNRLINFRVTDEEFQRLKTASAIQNARCLSDFAHSAVLETVRAGHLPFDGADTLAGQMAAFDRRLTRLESHMSRLFDALAEVHSAAVVSK